MPSKLSPVILLMLIITFMARLLTACGGEAAITSTPASNNGKPSGTTSPVSLPTPTPRPLSQPKVLRTVTGPRGAIDFTEVPDLNDGWPGLVWFDTINSAFSDKMQPTVRTLKEKYQTRVKFADLDFFDPGNRQIAELFHVTSAPSFVIIDRNGQTVRSWVGMVPTDELETTLKLVSGS